MYLYLSGGLARGSGEAVGLVGRGTGGPWVWWAVGLVLTDKIQTLRGPTCQGILGLVVFVFVFFSAKLFHSAPLSAATLLPTM